jgi:hypothetical protein
MTRSNTATGTRTWNSALSNADPDDCPEHVWVMTGMTTAADGTHIEYRCSRCGATSLEGPAELRGEVG